MKAVALQSISDQAPARTAQRAAFHRSPVSPWSIPDISASDQPLIQRKASCACGGGCPGCRQETEETIQPKLKVSTPGDQHEQEADRIADQVMRMPDSGSESVGVSRLMPLERQEALQFKSNSGGAKMTHTADATVRSVRGGGQPLPEATRAYFEPRLGQDFARVRVHADAEAATAARAVGARAYTRGHDIVFGAGEYEPTTAEGTRLLAHELVHVAQQSGSGDLVQRDLEEGMGDPAVAGEQDQGDIDSGEPDSGEPVEQGGRARCTGERNIDRFIHNFSDIDFTIPRGCTASVTFSARWAPVGGQGVDCCTGAETYTVTVNGGAAQRMPIGANICGDTDEHPRGERTITMGGGRKLLRVTGDRQGCEGISMDLRLRIRIR